MQNIVCCLITLTFLSPAGSCWAQTSGQQAAPETLPAKESASTTLTITSGVYGDPKSKKTKDVTRLLAGKIKDGVLRFDVNNDVLGDPAEGAAKTLVVKFKLNGMDHETKTEEGDTVLIPIPELKGNLVVTKAVYGDLLNNQVYDVTKQVQQMVKDNSLEVDASNDWFGDPASGAMKRLRVEYKIGDVALTKTRWEDSRLKISVPTPQPDGKEPATSDSDAAKP